jgi:hypothetical protein
MRMEDNFKINQSEMSCVDGEFDGPFPVAGFCISGTVLPVLVS